MYMVKYMYIGKYIWCIFAWLFFKYFKREVFVLWHNYMPRKKVWLYQRVYSSYLTSSVIHFVNTLLLLCLLQP